MQLSVGTPRRRACPFTAELSLDDLLLMARAELSEARSRLQASRDLLDIAGAPDGASLPFSPASEDDLSFEPSQERRDNSPA